MPGMLFLACALAMCTLYGCGGSKEERPTASTTALPPLCTDGFLLNNICHKRCTPGTATCAEGQTCQAFNNANYCLATIAETDKTDKTDSSSDNNGNSTTLPLPQPDATSDTTKPGDGSTDISSDKQVEVFNYDFAAQDASDCTSTWEQSPLDPEFGVSCGLSKREPQTTVLSIAPIVEPDASEAASHFRDRFPMLWQTDMFKSVPSARLLKLEARFRYASISGFGTWALSLAEHDRTPTYEKQPTQWGNLLEVTHNEASYLFVFPDGKFDATKDLQPYGFVTITYVFDRETEEFSFSLEQDEEILASHEGPGNEPRAMLIGYPVITDNAGYWGSIEIDYIKGSAQ